MKKRTLSALVISALTLLLLYHSANPTIMMSAAAIVCSICCYELACAVEVTQNKGLVFLAVALSAALCFDQNDGILYFAIASLLGSIPFFSLLMKHKSNFQLQNTASFLFLSALVIPQLAMLPRLRALPNGLLYVSIPILLCYITDVVAYLVGSRWGKRKLLPSVSPNKTILGAAAGLGAAVLFSLLCGVALHHFTSTRISFGRLLGYAVVAGLLAQFGDLSMSAVKRNIGIKDFGKLIPGHGGMLDRFDSHIFVLSFTCLFCCLTGGFLS